MTSDDHFSVDGTLIESYASIKSFQPVDQEDSDRGSGFKTRNPEVSFHGQKRSNKTHRSRTDPEARLFKKGDGEAAKLYHMGHALSENCHGLVVAVTITEASGTAECQAAIAMLDDLRWRQRLVPQTLGADTGYDSGPWMIELERRGVIPHTTMRNGPVGGVRGAGRRRKKDRPLIEARRRMAGRMKEAGYALIWRCRKRIDEAFGWCKTIGGLSRTHLIGRWNFKQQMELTAAAYNLVRMRKLLAA